MSIADLLNGILFGKDKNKPNNTNHNHKESDDVMELVINELPSQGFFYEDSFKISIKKADVEDIVLYDNNYKNDPLSIIYSIKSVVKGNIILPNGYMFEDILSIDIVYIFFMIVSYTKDEDVYVGKIKFNSDHFNYFDLNSLIEFYDNERKEFVMEGFSYKLPTIGIESSITNFISNCVSDGTINEYADMEYDFMFFLGDRKILSHEEIINLLVIFNNEMGSVERNAIKKIMDTFGGFNKYSLINEVGEVVEMDNIDLSLIWD